jgi:hypothetical protein
VPFIDEYYRAVIDSLVVGEVPEDLCEKNNDFVLYSCVLDSCNVTSEHCKFLNIDNIIDNTCFNNVKTCDFVQGNDISFEFSGIDTNKCTDLYISSGLHNDCTVNGEHFMYYCVKNEFCNRLKIASVAKAIAKGSVFSHIEFKNCSFHGVNDCPSFHTQVHTGSSQSLIKCLALNLSVFNFWEKYACSLACTSYSLFTTANIANIANSAIAFYDVKICTDSLLRMFVRHKLYIAHVLSYFNYALASTNRFLRGNSSASSIDLSDDSFDWLVMQHDILQTWGYGGNRFLHAKWEALSIDCYHIDCVSFLQCFDLDFGIPNWYCYVLCDRFLHTADLLIAVSTAVLFKHFVPDNYFHSYFVATFLINQFSAIYFVCLSIF